MEQSSISGAIQELPLEESSLEVMNDPEVTRQSGLLLLEQLAASGLWPPVWRVRDMLTKMSALEGAKALLTAKELGLPYAYQMVSDSGANISARDRDGNSLLHIAARDNMPGRVQVLLEIDKGLVNKSNICDKTALHVAAEHGAVGCLCLLLEAGASVHVGTYSGDTPLHLSARGGHTECMRVLMEKSADIEKRNIDGHTPLLTAALSNKPQSIRLLLNRGADVNVKSVRASETAFHICARGGYEECLQILMDRSNKFDEKNKVGQTPLLVAVARNKPQCVRRLVEAGANVNASTRYRETALQICARWGHAECLQILLMDKSVKLEEKSKDGHTPLLIAVICNAVECVRLLANAGANVNAKTGFSAALHQCAILGYAECAAVLIKAGASMDKKDEQKRTPLHKAAERNNVGVVKVLIEAGVNQEERDKKGLTALHVAAYEHRAECLQLLIEAGSDVNARTHNGATPLLLCVKATKEITKEDLRRNYESINRCMEILLHAKADSSGIDVRTVTRRDIEE